MDLAAIWDAITRNLATVSVVSLGGVLSVGIRWAYRRFNKTHRFKVLHADTVAVMCPAVPSLPEAERHLRCERKPETSL